MKIRTRYAPSPTGFMHIGNLRTALYEYLIAKSAGGDFILRIEDTDQERYVEGAEDAIYKALEIAGLKHDEGPDIGGKYGPYVQSQRKKTYLPYAKKLIDQGKAYYCFCSKERLDFVKNEGDNEFLGYDRHCRNLDESEIDKLLSQGKPYVIRQKMPIDGSTTFRDEVFGEVTVENKELQDQILIKADGYPTYNFANVIDDHEMGITYVVRGSEYLSSTPKYNLLYESFGWDIPRYVHLPLIMGKNSDGSISKISKRHGSVSLEDLINEGYLPEAILNYIALLGWCPDGNRELFSLEDLTKEFSVSRICKSPSVFDYDKLEWFNGEYIRIKDIKDFTNLAEPYIRSGLNNKNFDVCKISSLLQQRVTKFSQIPDMVKFLGEIPDYCVDIFINKKSKTTIENSLDILKRIKRHLENVDLWDYENLHNLLLGLAKEWEMKNGTVMWPVRIAVSGQQTTPGGAIEILDILGKKESIRRIDLAINKLI